ERKLAEIKTKVEAERRRLALRQFAQRLHVAFERDALALVFGIALEAERARFSARQRNLDIDLRDLVSGAAAHIGVDDLAALDAEGLDLQRFQDVARPRRIL